MSDFGTENLDLLFERLEGGNLLHPDGEVFGTTRRDLERGAVQFMGNFWDYSHAFRLTTADPKLIDRLDRAIAKQRASEAYITACEENRAFHASWNRNLPTPPSPTP
ncbi:hypothetical protein [Streptosporangium sp. G12]